VVAGTARDTAALVEFLTLNPEGGFRAAAAVGGRRDAEHPSIDVVDGHDSDDDEAPAPTVPWLGGYDATVAAVRRTGASGGLVAANHIPSGALQALLHEVSAIGLPVPLSSGLTGFAHSRLRTMPVAHEPFFVLAPLVHSAPQRIAKRAIDLVVA